MKLILFLNSYSILVHVEKEFVPATCQIIPFNNPFSSLHLYNIFFTVWTPTFFLFLGNCNFQPFYDFRIKCIKRFTILLFTLLKIVTVNNSFCSAPKYFDPLTSPYHQFSILVPTKFFLFVSEYKLLSKLNLFSFYECIQISVPTKYFLFYEGIQIQILVCYTSLQINFESLPNFTLLDSCNSRINFRFTYWYVLVNNRVEISSPIVLTLRLFYINCVIFCTSKWVISVFR